MVSSQLVITPGTRSAPVKVAVYDDAIVDTIGFKNFSLVLSTEENAARITTDVTIIVLFDDDCKLATTRSCNKISGCLIGLVPPPTVDVTAPESVEDGQPAVFRCSVTASSANITVYWLDENGKQ